MSDSDENEETQHDNANGESLTWKLGQHGTVCGPLDVQDQAWERDRELQQIIRQFTTVRRSFLLLGPSGVGKTALLKQAARQLISDTTAPWTIVQTSTSRLVSGKCFIGQWQQSVLELAHIATLERRVAVWLDDLPNIVAAGRVTNSEETMATALASFLERQLLLIFGEATPETYKRSLESFPAFARLLDSIHIEPHPTDVVRTVVERAAAARGDAAGERVGRTLRWTAPALEQVVQFGDTYFPGLAQPAGALRLVDRVLEDDCLRPLIRSVHPLDPPTADIAIQPSDVINALSLVTGAPRRMLDDCIPLPLAEVRAFFDARLVGQRRAIDCVVDLIAMIKAGLTDPRRPFGTMLFVGPTGVGKTELARTLAEFIFGSVDRLIRLDMSEYNDYGCVERLVGSLAVPDPPHGLLARVRRQPFSVILLDEIEKAHPSVFDLLLQLLDAGRLTRATGETINFTQSVIILTSNLGAIDPTASRIGFNSNVEIDMEEHIHGALLQVFRPELVNRIGKVVLFDPLQREDVRTLARRELDTVLDRGGIRRRRLQVDVDRGVIDILAHAGYDPRFGARPLKRAVERLVVAPLARWLSELSGARQPAIVQIYPNGSSVKLRSIDSPPAPPLSTERPNPEGHAQHWDRKQLIERAAALRAIVGELCNDAQRCSLLTRRSALVQASGESDFWNDPRAARATLAELYRIDWLIQHCDTILPQMEQLDARISRIDRNSTRSTVDALTSELDRYQRQATLVHFALLCDSGPQTSDVFVVFDAVDPEAAPYVEQLVHCYTSWARQLDFSIQRIHNDDADTGGYRQVVLKIEGVAVFGILAHEHGIHEFAVNAKSDVHRVKVSVFEVVDDRLPDDQVVVTTDKLHRRSKNSEGNLWQARAVYKPTGHDVLICTALSPSEAKSLVRELLVAELARQDNLARAHDSRRMEVIRRWWLGPRPHVRDLRTGVTLRRIKDVFAGQINPFLIAAMKGNS